MVNSLTPYIPSSDNMKSIACFAGGIAVCTLYSDYSSLWGWGAALCAFALSAIQRVKKHQEKKIEQEEGAKKFCAKMQSWLTECVNHEKNPYTEETRKEMRQLLNGIAHQSTYIRKGNDDFRPQFVGAQNAMEHVLAAQKILATITFIVAAIHTPLPATPLCTPVDGSLVVNLTASSLQHNSDKLCTVADRAISIRRMLAQEETLLYAVYPRGGLEKRKSDEQKVFLSEIENNEGRLIRSEINCESIDPAKVGALYLFTDELGNQYAFSIKAQQANSPQENSEWGIWLGRVADPAVKGRVKEINDYLKSYQGPNLFEIFSGICVANFKHT
jgi:hypothetical protein